MIIHPNKSAKTKITNLRKGDSQPNAVDIRLSKVFRIFSPTNFIVRENNDNEQLLKTLIEPNQDGFFYFEPGQYEISYENEVTIAPNECGYVIPRSTLVRNGIIIVSGLYDSGYSGPMVSVMHVTHSTFIETGSRVAQFVIFKSESDSDYKGNYGKKSKAKLDSHHTA